MEKNCSKRDYTASPMCIEIDYMSMTPLCASVNAGGGNIPVAEEDDWGTF